MMKKTSYIFATLLLLFSLTASAISAAAADRFYVEDVNLERGKTATIDFLLDNTTAFYGFQADVLLPDGLTMTSVALTSRAASSSFDLITNTVTHSDGRKYLRMGTFSTDHSPISGNSGALVRMTVDVASDFAGGTLNITDILFINNENQDVTLADCTANIGIGVSSITLDKTVLSLTEGESETLTATITPANATDPSVTWTSSDESIAKVEAGVVTAIKAGTATITVTTSNGKTATCTVTVNAKVIEVTGITLNKTTLSLTEGDTETLTATIAPANATDPSVIWSSSDAAVATVDANGNVTALKAGTATITAKSSNGKTATCAVTVKAKVIEVSGITLDKTTLNLTEGETDTLTATITPENATDKTVTWTSSDASIATVDNGKVTAIKAGTATITATSSNGKIATCTVTVTAKTPEIIEVTSITLDKTELSLTEGETATLTATITPADATDKSVTWSTSDAAVATVDATGKVTALKAGSAIITATSTNGKTATCAVTVTAPAPEIIEVTGITLNKTTLSLTEGETSTLTATITPADATDKTVTWTSNDAAVASVDASGKVTAVKAGTATITATSTNGKTATCTVTVTAKTPEIIEVTAITLDTTELSLTEGETATLIATITPADATDKSVTWTSSDATVATVDATGKVSALKAGTATITATSCNGLTVTCNVTVTAKTPEIIEVTSITLDKTELSQTEGETATLTATITPENATDKTVTWTSSDATVAIVDATGKVTALKAGTATITATSVNGKTATCTVIVTAKTPEIIEVTSITLDKTELSLTEGETATLTATITPANATDKTVTWTSNDAAVASVDASGKVTAVKAGTATITATSTNGKTATCTVTVTVPAPEIIEVTSITLVKTELSLTEGETATLTATIAPEDATDKTVTWTSSDATVATVDATGKVTAVKAGTATITVTSSNGLTATCNVTVTAKTPEIIEVTSITLDKTELSLTEGETATLTATITPENATDKTVTWTTSDATVATVDATGKVTALKAGSAIITATSCNGLTATCTVTVTAPAPEIIEVTSITLDKTELALTEGETETLTATVAPENATDKTVKWTTSDANIATVDANGKVTAAKSGTATITATSSNGKTATCTVTVKAKVIEVTGITLDKATLNLTEGETSTLTATITPADATDKSITWTSSDAAVATVDANGKVTALKAGTATIIATSTNGKTATCTVIVTAKTPEIIEVTSITLDKTELSLTEGETATLTATITPADATDKIVTWTTSDKKVATVDPEGNVTGIKEGTATITATSANGKTASCFVKVIERPLTPKQLLRKGNGTTCTFIVMMDMTDSELEALGYRYVFGYNDAQGNATVIAETDLRYCHTAPEIYNDPSNDFWVFTVLEKDGMLLNSNLRHLDGSEEVCFDASIYGYGTKGNESSVVAVLGYNDWIKVTPSTLIISTDDSEKGKIAIYSLTGAMVYCNEFQGNEEIELSRFSKGAYMVAVSCGGKMMTKKIIVRK